MLRWTGLIVVLVVGAGCDWGSETNCSCAPIRATVSVPGSLAGSAGDVTVGPSDCGVISTRCAHAPDGGGCEAYELSLEGAPSAAHQCQVTVGFAGGRASTVEFTWRLDPSGCCGSRTFEPSSSLTLPMPTPVDGGTSDGG